MNYEYTKYNYYVSQKLTLSYILYLKEGSTFNLKYNEVVCPYEFMYLPISQSMFSFVKSILFQSRPHFNPFLTSSFLPVPFNFLPFHTSPFPQISYTMLKTQYVDISRHVFTETCLKLSILLYLCKYDFLKLLTNIILLSKGSIYRLCSM